MKPGLSSRIVLDPSCHAMRRPVSIVVFGFALVFAFTSQASSASKISSFRIGEWSGGAYRDARGHAFDRCVAQTAGAGNAAIIYSLDSRYVWGLELSSLNWSFLRGASLPVTLRFGKRDSVTTRAVAVSPNVLRVRLADSLTLFEKLRSTWRMAIVAGGLRLTFDLPYANEVVQRLTRCVLRYQKRPRMAKKSVSIERSRADRRRSRTNPGSRAEASALGAEIMARTIGPKAGAVVAPDVQASRGADAAWKLHDFLFTVSALSPKVSPELGDLPSAVINRDAVACRGQLFAGALLERRDVPHIARIFTSCTDRTKAVSTYYLGAARKKGGFYLLSIFASSKEFNTAANRAAREFARLVPSRLRAVLSEP